MGTLYARLNLVLTSKTTKFMKLPGMSEPVPTEAEITVNEIVNSEIASTFSSKNDVKEITLYRMRAGSYKIIVLINGYRHIREQDEIVVLEKGKTKSVTFVADFTTGQTLHGWVRYFFEGKLYTVRDATIILLKKDETEEVDISANENGEYWLGGFSAGEYDLYIKTYGNWAAKRRIDHRQTLIFAPNEKKEINHEIQ